MANQTPEASDQQREKLAEMCHEQWTGWMRYLFSRCEPASGGMLIPGIWVERWQRQMDTPYARLTAREQDSDRREADRFLALVRPEQAASDTAQREALARERDSAERRCGHAIQQKEAAEARIATLEGLCRDQERALATLEAERVALEQALREYGAHSDSCDFRYRPVGTVFDATWYPCTCGLDAALKGSTNG